MVAGAVLVALEFIGLAFPPNQSYEKFVAKTCVRTLHTGGNLSGRIEDVKYAARMDLTAKMIPVMVQTVEKFTAMGASADHIVRQGVTLWRLLSRETIAAL
jgi:hypothetical protein